MLWLVWMATCLRYLQDQQLCLWSMETAPWDLPPFSERVYQALCIKIVHILVYTQSKTENKCIHVRWANNVWLKVQSIRSEYETKSHIFWTETMLYITFSVSIKNKHFPSLWHYWPCKEIYNLDNSSPIIYFPWTLINTRGFQRFNNNEGY